MFDHAFGHHIQLLILQTYRYRPVSLYFDLHKIAKEFILRLILSFYIYLYYLQNLKKSQHGK